MIKRTLYFGNPAYLSFKNKQLVIDKPDQKDGRATIPVEDIGIIVLDNPQITITHQLIQSLQDNLTAIVSCNQSHLPASLMLPFNGNHVMTERIRTQIEVSLPLKKQLWKQTVECKLNNQATLLTKLNKEASRINWLKDNVDPGDPKNTEGRAAAYYWKELFDDDFLRNPDGGNPNRLLNYAYAIIRAIVARALVSSGMHPTFGLFHSNKYNMYCLADDIMEPYRPFADQLVYKLFNENIIDDNLTPAIKRDILQLLTTDVEIDGKRSPLMVAVSRTTNSLFECYQGTRRKIIYPTFYETVSAK